jgi:hypothetical protein
MNKKIVLYTLLILLTRIEIGRTQNIGLDNNLRGASALVVGVDNQAIGKSATALGGVKNKAIGDYAVAAGFHSIAYSYGEWVGGMYNTPYTPISRVEWKGLDRIFVIGNGQHDTLRSNALTVYKNGTININDAYSLPNKDGLLHQVWTTNGNGILSWQNIEMIPSTKVGTLGAESFSIQTNSIPRLEISENGYVLLGDTKERPTSLLDINGKNGIHQFRLRHSFTPESTKDPRGNVGEVSWDENYIYIKTNVGWKRSSLTTF